MIYDAFLFRDEFTCLDVRLNELAGAVDAHVLIEADWTFQGGTKDLAFTEAFRAGSYRPDSYELIVKTLCGDPYPHGSAWAREAHAREAILEALEDAADDDYVILSDIDELPAASLIDEAIEKLPGGPSVAFKQEPRFYRFDNLCTNMNYKGSQIMLVATMRKNGAERIREHRWEAPYVEGGWHFCNLGDADDLIRKLQSFAHAELNVPENTDRAVIERMIEERRLLSNEKGYEFTLTDEGLPVWVLEHRDRFADLFYSKEGRWQSSRAQAAAQ